jgi:hypothetical protein
MGAEKQNFMYRMCLNSQSQKPTGVKHTQTVQGKQFDPRVGDGRRHIAQGPTWNRACAAHLPDGVDHFLAPALFYAALGVVAVPDGDGGERGASDGRCSENAPSTTA